MSILAWIVLGLIAGAIAKFIMPGPDPGGLVVTCLIGIAGAFVGGTLATFLGLGSFGGGFDIANMAVAVIGALILLFGYRQLT